ncbi:GNAT family N-acetyltransferase [Serratia entomophila]|uniref:GNAT family N-acetyltransferase n=1 Tax=Serratia entomophila TaxID=42906 RepID=UPI0021787AB9|nr:GNAT family N-acetyltransferase [Serratia entomophila]CAI1509726.1 Putative ribosomal N-acetyltransferase YdaF [Serratia entomophila]CAI1536274.1 Putative ribosomal N-acetyltransferase YdaF [Serratia entomophila]
MTIPVLTSPRLLLRPLTLGDVDDIQRLFPHWEIVRYMTNKIPWPYPQDGALNFLQQTVLPAMTDGRGWFWSIRRKEDEKSLIGVISLSLGDDSNRGFWLARDWQRQGLMSEACHVVTEYWFNVLGQDVLRVPKAADNAASRRISENGGMQRIATECRDYIGGRMNTEIWQITRAEWNGGPGRHS